MPWCGKRVQFLFATRRINANALANTIQRLSAGDLSARTGLAYVPDELGALARSIDEMAMTLEQRQTEHRQAK